MVQMLKIDKIRKWLRCRLGPWCFVVGIDEVSICFVFYSKREHAGRSKEILKGGRRGTLVVSKYVGDSVAQQLLQEIRIQYRKSFLYKRRKKAVLHNSVVRLYWKDEIGHYTTHNTQ